MVERCKNGHLFNADNPKRPKYGCLACSNAATRRCTAKKRVATGKWWKGYCDRTLSDPQIRAIARDVGRGKLLWEVTAGVHIYRYLSWVDWKHSHPAAAAAIKRQSAVNRWARRRERLEAMVASPAILRRQEIPPNLWQLIAAVTNGFGEMFSEVRQRLAVAVMEGRCSCDADSLRRQAALFRGAYFKDYANPWGDSSIDATTSDGNGGTYKRQYSRGLWDEN